MTRKGHSYLDLTALPEIGALLLAPQPAWLWSLETKKVLWANAAAAAHSGAESIEALLDAETTELSAATLSNVATGLSEDVPQMRQLPAIGSDLGDPLWCLCTRFALADGSDALLSVATEIGGNVDPMSVRVGRLVRSIAGPDIVVAVARRDGRIVATSTGFSDLPGAADIVSDLTTELGADRLRKRKETFGGERRLAGAAVAATPDGDFALVIIGPAEELKAERQVPAKSIDQRKGAPSEPSAVAATSVPRQSEKRSGRFTFSLNPDLTFSAVSDALAKVVGSENADIIGRSWDDVSDAFHLDPDRTIAIALARRDTWSGVTVHWPNGSDDTVAIDLTAIPSFRNGGAFEGFRGFGVVRGGAAEQKTDAIGGKTPNDPTETSESKGPPEDPEPSNVVRLPSADRVEEKSKALSGDEQDAFRRIAETLRSVVRRSDHPTDEAAAAPKTASNSIETQSPPGKIPLRLLDRLPIGILVFREKAVMFANRILLDRIGYPNIAALANAGGVDALFGDDPPELEDTDAPYRVPLVTADRRRINAEARLHIVPWDDGPATMLSIRDPMAEPVAAVKVEQEPTRSRVQELEAILDTATDGTLVLDEEGRILGLNRSAEALFGIESTDVIGKPFTELLAEESRRPAEDYLEGIARNGVASVLNDGREVIGRVPNGGLIPLFMTMGRLAERNKFCAVLRDITQWKNAEEELVTARRSAEIANKQKSDFLAKISHEIRTPLNAIIGFSDVMLEERFGPIGVDRYREYLKDIRLSGRHLMSLINDLLDLSKIESGHLDLAFGAVAINQILQECVALMQPEANRKRIIIRTSLTEGVPQVVADERSLRQIALNLLSNAVKFNVPGGQVIVSTALDNGEVILRIRDTGIGMTEKEVETALKPFQQIATAGPTRFEGTGLGLPLTKALVEANRASFEIDSEPSKGTLVRIAFPIERVLQP